MTQPEPRSTKHGSTAGLGGYVALPCVNWAGAAGGDDAPVPGAHAATGAEEEMLVGSFTGQRAWRS